MSSCNITHQFFVGYTVKLTLLSCRDPPALHTVITDAEGVVLLDNDIDQSVSAINLGGGSTMDITLDQLDNAIGVKVRIY